MIYFDGYARDVSFEYADESLHSVLHRCNFNEISTFKNLILCKVKWFVAYDSETDQITDTLYLDDFMEN